MGWNVLQALAKLAGGNESLLLQSPFNEFYGLQTTDFRLTIT